MMQIGALCQSTGMSKDTIRFYEKIGLLGDIKRKANGYKDYSQGHVEQLKLLKHAKELGFTLNEIKELAGLFLSKKLPPQAMNDYLKKKEVEIDKKIARLQAFKQEIKDTLAGNCIYKEQLIKASAEG
ncbi:MerR family transcriptional regulator [Thalassomonas sp. RHCl1]|uniref:MerR family transcriptional regulator n=1 Tax=Thalassomonas sp. RHCl1 TaxID=2995320 RepID=UPI0032B1FB80